MPQVTLVTGHAGTGKTTWLMAKAKESSFTHLNGEHQRILALSRMHGARRRLEAKLEEHCGPIPRFISTIDGFALSIVNRWRTSLSYTRPLIASPTVAERTHTEFGIEVPFDTVLNSAAQLLSSPTVGRIIGESYPVIVVDEFQDCAHALLGFISALVPYCSLVLAADDFQSLDSNTADCPAVVWARGLYANDGATIEELSTCHRTSSSGLLAAAKCLRQNTTSPTPTVPVVCCPSFGPAAWKIIEKLVCSDSASRWRGSCALICPSHDPILSKVLESCDAQLHKKNLKPIRWQIEATATQERESLFKKLSLTDESFSCGNKWSADGWDDDALASHVVARVTRFSRLRGMTHVPNSLVAKHAEKVLHERRAYSPAAPNRAVTTVHGAKNREFDNVFVLWTYKLPPDREQQRRLLYNAVTRSRQNCMVLVLGSEQRAKSDPVLSLLGPAQPAFPVKNRKNKTTKKEPTKSKETDDTKGM